jgi:serine acetyltransferase
LRLQINALLKQCADIKGHPTSKGDVNIGNDVWIASDVKIMSGVSIGDGAVIAANALVTRDVPAYTMAGGLPAKIIKPRFEPEVVNQLKNLRWWDWSLEKLAPAIPLLMSNNFEALFEYSRNFDRG